MFYLLLYILVSLIVREAFLVPIYKEMHPDLDTMSVKGKRAFRVADAVMTVSWPLLLILALFK